MPARVRVRSVLAALLAAVVLLSPSPATAKAYHAERYDVRLALRDDGALEVTETATFVFDGQGETFHRVYRDIPAARTDGIDVLAVTFDGQPLALDGPSVRVVPRDTGIRVEVLFAPLAQGRRTLELRYRARQAISREGDTARLRWTPLPDRRGYRIEGSTVEIVWHGLATPPTSVRTRRDDGVSVVVARNQDAITIASADLRANRAYQVQLELPAAAVSAYLPQWQRVLDARNAQRRERIAYGAGAGALVVLGFALVWRQHRPSPGERRPPAPGGAPPSGLPVALASALARHGRVAATDFAATVVDLARQGFLRFEGPPGTEDQSGHRLVRRDDRPPAHDHEREALALLFPGDRRQPAPVPYGDAVSRASKALGPFKDAVRRELLRGGWLDEQRLQVRGAMVRAALAAVGVGALAVVLVLATATVAEQRDWAWVAGGMALAGVVGLLLAGTVSPLSDRGAAEARRWSSYRRALLATATGKAAVAGVDWNAALPFAVASGLGGAIAARAAVLGVGTPDWFHPDRRRDGDVSFHGWLASTSADSGSHASTSGSDGAGSGDGGGGGSGAD